MTDITLPDTTGSRMRRPGASVDVPPAPVDDVAQTLAEYERLAISTGARVQINAVHYWSGLTIHEWTPVWLEEEPPAAARATVFRDGVPTTVVRTWREALPGEGVMTDDGREWRAIWAAQPMRRFESYVIRAALARAFRDVIGRTYEPGDPRVANTPPAPVAPPLSAETRAEHERLVDGLAAKLGIVETRPMPDPAPRLPKPDTRPMPKPETRPYPTPAPDRPLRRPPRDTAISQAFADAEQASGKTVSRRSASRAQRDSGRRGGGRR